MSPSSRRAAQWSINPERLLADLHTLRTFGKSGPGVVRTAFSPADIESRFWLVDRMSSAGLDARIDGVGNVFGQYPKAVRTLLIGSHTDSQPEGGWLDGSLGVIYGLEIARSLLESRHHETIGVDVVSWSDEEMRFAHFLGSRTFCGMLTADERNALVARDGQLLSDAIRDAGLNDRPVAQLDRRRHVGYLEAHIEQGGVLEAAGMRIGIVTAIAGIRSFRVHFTGHQNHAGSTPMHLRRDAGLSLLRFGAAADEEFRKRCAPATVWTFGYAHFHPGAESIIPGKGELAVQIRDADDTVLSRMEEGLRELAAQSSSAEAVVVEVRPTARSTAPATMDASYQGALRRAATRIAPDRWMLVPSGAGHDAQILSLIIPTAMLFVPSIGGISHSFQEDTAERDIALGCEVLAEGVRELLPTI